ncbi:hypothetical protein [Affinirhizobium pseudoryzae]|jgi:hypothetical protein|nr:hypothetical protein [Allorhizobium pseudoryzae]
MTAITVFYLYGLPVLLVAAVGALIGVQMLRDRHKSNLHPGE